MLIWGAAIPPIFLAASLGLSGIVALPASGRAASPGIPDTAASTPATAPIADAEVVHRTLSIIDGVAGDQFARTIEEFRLVKVHTRQGAQEQSEGRIPYFEGMQIEDISVRCKSPDGHTRMVVPEKMFDRVLYRIGRFKVSVRTFALPGIVPGSTIESYVRTSLPYALHLRDLWMPCQEDIPVRDFELKIRPWVGQEMLLRMNSPPGAVVPITKDGAGFLHIRARDIPAYREEPLAPSELETRLMVVGTYVERAGGGATSNLLADCNAAEQIAERSVQHSRQTPAVAESVTAGIADTAGRLRALYRFCRTHIRNSDLFSDSTTDAAHAEVPRDQVIDETLRRRAGSTDAVNWAFMALARQAGFDAHLVFTLSGALAVFDPNFPVLAGPDHALVAVMNPGGWSYYDPGLHWGAYGRMGCEAEGEQAVLGSRTSWIMRLPESPAESSVVVRRAILRLDAEGAAEGDVEVERTGFEVERRLRALHTKSAHERETEFGREVQDRYPSAEVGEIRWSGADDPDNSLREHCHVRVADFAQPAGDRLLFTLGLFARGAHPLASSIERLAPVSFPHAWTEIDSVTFVLPRGMQADIRPGGVTFPVLDVGECSLQVQASAGRDSVMYVRRLAMRTPHRLRVAAADFTNLSEALARTHSLETRSVMVLPAPAGSR